MKTLDPGWWQWLAENRLMDNASESIIQTMMAHGFERAVCAHALADLDAHPVMKAARNHQLLHRKLESVVGHVQALQQASPAWDVIEKRVCPSRDEFIERYVHACRPVVLTDYTADWPARQRWTPAALRDRFADLEVEVQAGRESDPRFEENKDALKQNMRFAEFIDRISAPGDSNDIYLTANNELLKRAEFSSLFDDVGTQRFCDPARLRTASFFWVGPQGTNTPLHHDTVMLFHAQLHGRKRWRLISPLDTPNVYNYNGVFSPVDVDAPDFKRFPRFRQVKMLEVIVEPGETIFLPLGWWHQVSALALSVSLSVTHLDLKNDYPFRNPTMRHW